MSSPVRLSPVRTVLLWGLAIVWFAEMTLWDVRALAEMWTRFWVQFAPSEPNLATALYLTHATEGAAKGAFGVLAVYALRSGLPFVRAALFVPMALVPPLNLLFQFRAQGFPLRPTLIGATLSVILWQTFFLFRDRAPLPEYSSDEPAARRRLTPAERIAYAWFGVNAVVLSAAALLFLFAPDTGVHLAFGSLTRSARADGPLPEGLTFSAMAVGTHLAALAIATWIGTVSLRRSPIVRQAVTAASTLHAALVCAVPFARLARVTGGDSATSSLLVWSVPLLAGWVVFAALSHRTSPAALDVASVTY